MRVRLRNIKAIEIIITDHQGNDFTYHVSPDGRNGQLRYILVKPVISNPDIYAPVRQIAEEFFAKHEKSDQLVQLRDGSFVSAALVVKIMEQLWRTDLFEMPHLRERLLRRARGGKPRFNWKEIHWAHTFGLLAQEMFMPEDIAAIVRSAIWKKDDKYYIQNPIKDKEW